MVGLARNRGHGIWREGDRVRFHYGVREVVGTIAAVVGPIGSGRRMLYRIEFQNDVDGYRLVTELTEDQFKRA